MKIKEIVSEGKTTEMHPNHQAAHAGSIFRTRDVGGYDRVYHMNRFMMAMAKADGKSTKAVDSPADTWFEKYNTVHPYTDAERNMALAAMNTVPTDGSEISTDSKSREDHEIHKVSPHRQVGAIQQIVKSDKNKIDPEVKKSK